MLSCIRVENFHKLKNLGLKVHLEPCKLIKFLINEERGMILKASKVRITPLQLRKRAAQSYSKH